MSVAGLLMLPDEVQWQIVNHLRGREYKVLRLVSRRYCRIVSPLLYPRVWLSPHPLDISVFESVMSNPMMTHGVNELIWDDTTFPDLSTCACYFDAAESRPDEHWESYRPSSVAFQLWYQTAKKHHTNRATHRDQRLLFESMHKLQSLHRITLTNCGAEGLPRPSKPEEWSSDDVREKRSPTVQQWHDWASCGIRVPFPPYVKWAVDVSQAPRDPPLEWMLDTDYDGYKPYLYPKINRYRVLGGYPLTLDFPFRGLIILLRALHHHPHSVKEFVVEPCYNTILNRTMPAGISHWFFRNWHADLERMESLFQNLTKLHLVLSGDGPHARITASKGHLSRVLGAAAQLQHLHLEAQGMPSVGLLDRGVTYKFLQTATFEGDIDPDGLLFFLDRHRPTLSELRLQYCTLLILEWKLVLRSMRNKHLNLKLCTLHELADPTGVWTAEDEFILLSYLQQKPPGHTPLRKADKSVAARRSLF